LEPKKAGKRQLKNLTPPFGTTKIIIHDGCPNGGWQATSRTPDPQHSSFRYMREKLIEQGYVYIGLAPPCNLLKKKGKGKNATCWTEETNGMN